MSCRGDAYNPGDALAVDEALEFHAWQAEKLVGHIGQQLDGIIQLGVVDVAIRKVLSSQK